MIKTYTKSVWVILFLVTFFLGKLPAVADPAEDFENNPEVIAQWNLSVGSLAMDEYQYLDALAYFEDAFEISKMAKTQVRALLYKATTFATFLHSPDSALKIYQHIQKKYPDFAETAFYQEALLLFEEGRYSDVVAKIKAYVEAYPSGRFRYQVELLLEQSDKIVRTQAYQKRQKQQEKARLRADAKRKENIRRKAASEAMQREATLLKAKAEADAREAARLKAEAKAEAKAYAEETARLKAEAEAYAREAARLRAEAAADAREVARLKAETDARNAARLKAEANAREVARLKAETRLREATRLQAQAEEESRKSERLKKEAITKEMARLKDNKEELENVQSLAASDFKSIEEPTVRVLLSKSASTVSLKGSGLIFFTNGTPSKQGDNIRLKVNKGVIVQDGRNGSTFGQSIKVTADGPIKVTYGRNKQHNVRGFLVLSKRKRGIRVINHVKMEAYLRGVVPSESPSSWELDALKSQALAARTYAYNHVRSHAKKSFDVYATTRSQVYGGVARERRKTDKAVAETSGEIITAVVHGKLKPILAMYASNSGGHTADPKKEYDPHWDPPHYLVAQKDPWSLKAGKRGLAFWKYTHSLKDVEKNLAKRRVRVPNLASITPVYIGPSGRVVTVRLMYDGGKSKTIRFRPKVTRGLGAPRIGTLPDTIVTIKKKGSQLTFDGKGFGHGIGYMQFGGQYMAKAGHSYREILGFYYPQTKIMRYWN